MSWWKPPLSTQGDITVKGFFRDLLNRKYLDFYRSSARTLDFFREIIRMQHKRFLAIGISESLVMSAIAIGIPYLAKLEIDQLVDKKTQLFHFVHGTPYGIFLVILAVILFAHLFDRAMWFVFEHLTSIDNMRMRNNINIGIYEKFLLIEPGFSLSKRNDRLLRELRSSGSGIPNRVKDFASSLVSQTFSIGSILTILGMIDWRIFPWIVLSLLVGAKIRNLQEAYRLRFELQDGFFLEHELREVNDKLETEYVNIRMNGAEDAMLERAKNALGKQIELERKSMLHDLNYRILNVLNEGISGAIVKGIVGYAIFAWTGSVGLMTMSIMYVDRIEEFFSFLVDMVPRLRSFSDNVRKFEIFLAIAAHGETLKQEKFQEEIQAIRIKRFTFRYPKMVQEELQFVNIAIQRIKQYSSKPDDQDLEDLHMLENLRKEAEHPAPIVLRNVTTEFRKWRVYGIIGKNGAGKTTLIHQILGFFTEYDGSLKYNDTEVRAILGSSLGKLASIVSQDPFILDGIFTIRENLLLGVTRETSDKDLWQFLEEFGLAKKIRSFRLGLDTPLGWDIDLSGGQRQLIVIIRVILQDRQILIFDEGTSQLDAENELLVMKRLLERKSNKIIIFITHRLSTIRKADTILCLEKGRISDMGSHEELLARDSLYKKFYEMQMGGKFDGGGKGLG